MSSRSPNTPSISLALIGSGSEVGIDEEIRIIVITACLIVSGAPLPCLPLARPLDDPPVAAKFLASDKRPGLIPCSVAFDWGADVPINVEARTLTIGELLGGDHVFSMPPFQRPYSWGEEEAGQLFDDVHAACEAEGDENEYFLGQLILARPNRQAPFDVIDGQQRLITLTVLLAMLRDLLPPGQQRDSLQSHVLRPGNFAKNQAVHVRVSLRHLDNSQFENWITKVGGTSTIPKTGDTDATSRIAAVVRRLIGDIGSVHTSYITKLADFILKRCYVAVVTTHTPHDAYILFRSINARGQPLTDLDIARGEFIRPHQNNSETSVRLAAAWDNIEDAIGVEQLSSYVKTIAAIVMPSTQPLDLTGAMRHVLQHPSKSVEFIDTLRTFVELYEELDACDLEFGEDSAKINRVVSCIQALPFDDWRGAALLWLSRTPSPSQTLDFFKALDALGLGLLVLGATSQTIAKRFARVLTEVVERRAMTFTSSAIFLTDQEKSRITNRLQSPIPARSRFARPLLLRLNAEMLDDQIPTYFPTKVTLEHILPQKPAPRSAWHKTFPEKTRRQELSQLLGNFTILTNTANPRASNFDFHRKRKTIFGAKGSNVFPLTAELVNYDDWNEENILKRHKQLNALARNILKL